MAKCITSPLNFTQLTYITPKLLLYYIRIKKQARRGSHLVLKDRKKQEKAVKSWKRPEKTGKNRKDRKDRKDPKSHKERS